MAKQIGPYKITGTIQNICYYKMDGQYYARLKSSLDGKRVKTDPAFAETMRYAELLGRASKLVSTVYHRIPKEERSRELFKRLTGETMKELGKGERGKK